MKAIIPVDITDANLTSSSVPETDYAAWLVGTSYALGAHVIRGHRRWESLAASNSGNDPLLTPTATVKKWVDMGPTNQWAMFDDSVGTVTSATSSIVVVMTPGMVSMLALLDLYAESATLAITVGGIEVWSQTQTTQRGGEAITDWYLYFTAPIGRVSTIIFEDLPQYDNAVLTLTVTSIAPGGPVSIGTLAVGRDLEIGTVENGVKAGIKDFSEKKTDDFGQTRFLVRSFAKRMGLRLKIQEDAVDNIYSTLAAVRAKPIVWIASRRFDCLVIYGAWDSFDFDIQFGPYSFYSLDIIGLV